MNKTHLKIICVDHGTQGKTEFNNSHRAACGYVRDKVSIDGDAVDCKLCLRSEHMKHYHQINNLRI